MVTPTIYRKGEKETYDERKVYASCYAAALQAKYAEKEAEELAAKVSRKVSVWIRRKGSASSHEIHQEIVMAIPDSAVALAYKRHLDLP